MLTELANELGTDKGTIHGNAHGYSLVYDVILGGLRNEDVRILEVGLARGGPEVEGGTAERETKQVPSVELWKGFFPNCKVYGVDISDFSKFTGPSFEFYQGDCGDMNRLKEIAAEVPELDVVIDDGSHASFHQQNVIHAFMSRLKPGGIMIMEDLDWQPTHYEKSLPKVPLTTDVLAALGVGLDKLDLGAFSRSDWNAIDDQVRSVLFFDTDDLNHLSAGYNRRSGATNVHRTPSLRHSAGTVKRRLKKLGEALVGRTKRPFCDRPKLAIIQKNSDKEGTCDAKRNR